MDALHFQGLFPRVPLLSARPNRSRVSLPNRFLRLASQSQLQSSQPEVALPEKLRSIVTLFSSVGDPRARYEQLMFYAKRLPPLAEEFHTRENKVEGCVSQVWVRVQLDEQGKIQLQADSDSILTKGLAALLVEGLSGSSPEQVVSLDPSFIQMLGLKQSLTPARNNGFYNMLGLVRKKALELQMNNSSSSAPAASTSSHDPPKNEAPAPVSEASGGGDEISGLGSRGLLIRKKLEEALSPSVLQVEDVSHQHAGHAGVRGISGGETHFNVKVVSSQFEGRSLVKRHRLVYDLLQDELNSGLHALSIVAKTPAEVQN